LFFNTAPTLNPLPNLSIKVAIAFRPHTACVILPP